MSGRFVIINKKPSIRGRFCWTLSAFLSTQIGKCPKNHDVLNKEAAKKNVFFLETFPKSVYPPTHPRVFVRFGKTKGEIWVKKGDFWGGLEGFGPCLGISHPTHPHLGKISQKKRFFLAASLTGNQCPSGN